MMRTAGSPATRAARAAAADNPKPDWRTPLSGGVFMRAGVRHRGRAPARDSDGNLKKNGDRET